MIFSDAQGTAKRLCPLLDEALTTNGFKKSRQRIEPYDDYPVWRIAKSSGKLPNNRDALLEGKEWVWDEVRLEYYIYLFLIDHADLNMDHNIKRCKCI